MSNEGEERIPEPIARLLGRAASSARRLPARQPVWRLATRPPVVLRRSAEPVRDPEVAAAELTWLPGFLDDLTSAGFPAPRPAGVLGGASWLMAAGYSWQVVTYLPGRPLMWVSRPGLEHVGVLLARYRIASASCSPRDQRPSHCSLVSLLEAIAKPADTELQLLKARTAGRLAGAVSAVLAALREEGLQEEPRGVIHGDPTVRNIIVADLPARMVGLVDFELAHVDHLLVDLAYSLYVTARPEPDAIGLRVDRFQAVVRGYSTMVSLDARRVRLAVVLIAGRGLQMIARGLSHGIFLPASFDRVQWVLEHRHSLEEAAASSS